MTEFERGQIVGEYVVLCRPGLEQAARVWADERGLDGAEIRASAYIPEGEFIVTDVGSLNDMTRGRPFDEELTRQALDDPDAWWQADLPGYRMASVYSMYGGLLVHLPRTTVAAV